MHCLRDANDVDQFIATSSSPTLSSLIVSRVEDLASFDDLPISELVNFHIAMPDDSADAVSRAIGIPLLDSPIDLCERHTGWFELTIISSDDGFGHIVYIPINTQDPMLYEFCCRHASSPPETHP